MKEEESERVAIFFENVNYFCIIFLVFVQKWGTWRGIIRTEGVTSSRGKVRDQGVIK